MKEIAFHINGQPAQSTTHTERGPVNFTPTTIEVGGFTINLKTNLLEAKSFSRTSVSASGTVLVEWDADKRILSVDTI